MREDDYGVIKRLYVLFVMLDKKMHNKSMYLGIQNYVNARKSATCHALNCKR